MIGNGTGTSATVAARGADGPAAMLAGCLALLTVRPLWRTR